jgi:hypothetical protein
VARPASDDDVRGVLCLRDSHERLSKEARDKAHAAAAELATFRATPEADAAAPSRAQPPALLSLISAAAAAEAAADNARMELMDALLFFIGCPLKTAAALGFLLPPCAFGPAPEGHGCATTTAAANLGWGVDDNMAALEVRWVHPCPALKPPCLRAGWAGWAPVLLGC